MIVSEVFTSIQGEGSLAGVPAVFARLPGGAAKVTWCEEPRELWVPDADAKLGAVLANIRRRFTTYAVICGAEPLEAGDDLERLSAGMKPLDLHVTVETSGSIFSAVTCDLLSINVRLRNPTVPRRNTTGFEELAYDVEVLRELVATHHYQMKFEVADRAEMEEVRNLVVEVGADRDKVILQPLAGTGKEQKERWQWVMEASRFFGYRMVPRLPVPPAPPKPKKAAHPKQELPPGFPMSFGR